MSFTFLLAHILGIPVEEFIVPWASGGLGAGILMVLHPYLLRTVDRLVSRRH